MFIESRIHEMKINQQKWEKGNGEMIGFAISMIALCSIFLIIVSTLQLSVGLNAMRKAINVVGRSAAICTSMEDAETQVQRVADSSITYSGITDLETNVEFATSDTEWKSGNFLKVTVKAKINTLAPLIPFEQSKSTLVCIENTNGSSIMIPINMGMTHTYMAWQLITDRSSRQFQLREESGQPFDAEGFGKINGRYVIACTSLFGQVGDYVDFYREDGQILRTVIGDIKNSSDFGCNIYGHNNGRCVVEFIVDENTWYTGGRGTHANPGTPGCHPEWSSRICKAVKLNRNF